MAYTSGDLILDDHYNTFATGSVNGSANHNVANVNTVNGTGTGDKGYGQTGNLPSVSTGVVVSATQWANMFTKIGTLAAHQGSTVGPEPLPITGDMIEAVAVLNADVNTIYTERFNASVAGSSSAYNTSRTTQWNNTVTMTQTVTFGNTNNLRYFFNAGGLVHVNFARSGGSSDAKNTAWSQLCSNCGSIYLSSTGIIKTIAGVAYNGTTKRGGSGTVNSIATGTGFHQLTSSDTLLFRQYHTSTYSSNRIDVFGKVSGTVLTITTVYHDDANGNGDEYVNGTLTTTITRHSPSTSNLSDTWGTPSLGGSQTGS